MAASTLPRTPTRKPLRAAWSPLERLCALTPPSPILSPGFVSGRFSSGEIPIFLHSGIPEPSSSPGSPSPSPRTYRIRKSSMSPSPPSPAHSGIGLGLTHSRTESFCTFGRSPTGGKRRSSHASYLSGMPVSPPGLDGDDERSERLPFAVPSPTSNDNSFTSTTEESCLDLQSDDEERDRISGVIQVSDSRNTVSTYFTACGDSVSVKTSGSSSSFHPGGRFPLLSPPCLGQSETPGESSKDAAAAGPYTISTSHTFSSTSTPIFAPPSPTLSLDSSLLAARASRANRFARRGALHRRKREEHDEPAPEAQSRSPSLSPAASMSLSDNSNSHSAPTTPIMFGNPSANVTRSRAGSLATSSSSQSSSPVVFGRPSDPSTRPRAASSSTSFSVQSSPVVEHSLPSIPPGLGSPKFPGVPENLAWLAETTVELLIDQEGFRAIRPSFMLVGYNIHTAIAEFKPLKRTMDVFHHSNFEPPPILRRLLVNGDEGRDHISRQASLSIKSSGVYTVRGMESPRWADREHANFLSFSDGDAGKLEWKFAYVVEDRITKGTSRVARGEKTLTPLSFSCSPMLLHATHGEKIRLVQIAKKSVLPKLSAHKLKPPTAPPTPLPRTPLKPGGNASAGATAESLGQPWSLIGMTPSPARGHARTHSHASDDGHGRNEGRPLPRSSRRPKAASVGEQARPRISPTKARVGEAYNALRPESGFLPLQTIQVPQVPRISQDPPRHAGRLELENHILPQAELSRLISSGDDAPPVKDADTKELGVIDKRGFRPLTPRTVGRTNR